MPTARIQPEPKPNDCRHAQPHPCTCAGDSDQRWLQVLEDILQDIPGCFTDSSLQDFLLLNLPHGQQLLSQPTLNSEESVGALNTAMLALSLWQRALGTDDIVDGFHDEQHMRCERVERLER